MIQSDGRSLRRLATRQSISNAATRLFFKRGFDRVTIDEIAAAAGVSRMTVFNHFPRKEDLFFDRDEEGREAVRRALGRHRVDVSPVESLRLEAHRLVAEGSPLVEFSARSQRFVNAIERSVALKARARAIRDELTHFVAAALAARIGGAADEAAAQLAAGVLLATWSTAFILAHATFRQTKETAAAEAAFLAAIDRGSAGAQAVVAGTPYA